MSTRRVLELENRIIKAKQAYYFGSTPIMSDAEYDALEDELRELAPGSSVLAGVGAPVPPDTILHKAKHKTPMGSQSKVNSAEEFRTWFEKSVTDNQLHATLKGDGASAAAYYEAGQLLQAISRGDGFEGEDITANAVKFKGLPVRALDDSGHPFTGAVRFEVILTLADWALVDPDRTKNPRNAGNGIMGRKNGHQSQLLSAYAFSIDELGPRGAVEFATESEKFARLAELGFQCIPGKMCVGADEACAYYDEVVETRAQLPFWIDGVVYKVEDLKQQERLGITANRPKGQIAWKFDSKGAETTLLDYSISVGHTGALIPTAHLQPVEIAGTTVSNALLNNWDEIGRLDVAVGDRVWLIKANDIIPKITAVRKRPKQRTPIPEPTQCPVCHGPVARRLNTGGEAGAVIECQNEDCPAKSIGKLKRWIKSLDIQGIGDVVRHALVEQLDVEDASGLYKLRESPGALAKLVINPEAELHLGEKRAQTILDSIESKRTLSLVQFMGSLGIERLGLRRVELMIRAAGGELDELDDWLSDKLRDADFAARVGLPKMGSVVQDSIDAQRDVIKNLRAAGVRVEGTGVVPLEAGEQPRTLCISGKLASGKKKDDYAQSLSAAGIELVDSVTKDLTYLVLADPTSNSGKAQKAKKYGVQVISEAELVDLISAES